MPKGREGDVTYSLGVWLTNVAAPQRSTGVTAEDGRE